MSRKNSIKPEQWAILRRLYEADPQCSYADIAAFTNQSRQAVRQRGERGGWRKVALSDAEIKRAHAEAKSAFDPPPDGEKKAVLEHTKPAALGDGDSEALAVRQRTKIIERHRQEWLGARNLVYQALREENLEKAKLGKMSAESLQIIQNGERRAWGLDLENNEIVVERV